jgi:hypothetical protein
MSDGTNNPPVQMPIIEFAEDFKTFYANSIVFEGNAWDHATLHHSAVI